MLESSGNDISAGSFSTQRAMGTIASGEIPVHHGKRLAQFAIS